MTQQLPITIVFTTEHSPNREEHLEVILQSYFKSKGVDYQDRKIII